MTAIEINSSYTTNFSMEALVAMTSCISDLGFVLVTQHERTTQGRKPVYDYQYHFRDAQPCFGGEQRKYECDHGDLCSHPDSEKPGDLYAPFPEGKLYAVGYKFNDTRGNEDFDAFMSALYAEDSPFIRGFRYSGRTFVEKNGHIVGVVFEGMDVDPTVCVSAGQFAKTVAQEDASGFCELLRLGMSPKEALIAFFLNSGKNPLDRIYETETYYFPYYASIRRLVDGNPNDYSGGLWDEGVDYNRRSVQDIFSSTVKGEGVNLYEALQKKFSSFPEDWGSFTPDAKPEDIVNAIKALIYSELLRVPEVQTPKYQLPEAFLKATGKIDKAA